MPAAIRHVCAFDLSTRVIESNFLSCNVAMPCYVLQDVSGTSDALAPCSFVDAKEAFRLQTRPRTVPIPGGSGG